MLKQFFQLPDTEHLLDVFIKLQNVGFRQAIIIRTLIALFFALWLFLIVDTVEDFFYFLALISLFIGSGLAYFIISETPYYRLWQPYLLYAIDITLLTLALVYQPEQGIILEQSLNTGQGFLAYFILIALSFFSCNPLLIIWMFFLSLISLLIAAILLLEQSLMLYSWTLWAEYMLGLLVVTNAAIWMLHYLYKTMVQQINIEREFYDILIHDRQNNKDTETYTDILTGFGTRAAFDRDSAQFTTVFSEGRLTDLTIAFIDLINIDDFRATKGEEAYHQLLREFAKQARRYFRTADMLYYFSNDKFALLAPGASIDNAARLQGLLQDILGQLHQQDYQNINAEMGISTLDQVQKNSKS